MTRLLVRCALACSLLVAASPVDAAIAEVANVSQRFAAATGGTTAAINTTGADLIVVSASWYPGGGGNTVNITDSKSNTWTGLTAQAAGVSKNQLFYCTSCTVGSGHTFSIVSPGVDDIYAVLSVVAFSGAHASPFGAETGQAATGQTSYTAGSLTPSEGNAVVVVGITANDTASGLAPSANGGFTSYGTAALTANSMGGGIAYLIQTSAAAANPTWSWGGGSTDAAATNSWFKSAAGGGGATCNGGLSLLGVGGC